MTIGPRPGRADRAQGAAWAYMFREISARITSVNLRSHAGSRAEPDQLNPEQPLRTRRSGSRHSVSSVLVADEG